MAIELSARAELLSQRRLQAINVIVEIEGWPVIYGAMKVLEVAKFDTELFFDENWNFDGLVEVLASNDLISLQGTTRNISSQIFPDKQAHQSIQRVQVQFLDENNEITNMISPGIGLTEVLGTRAKFYANYGNGAHPEDSILLHAGCIDGVKTQAGAVTISIASNEAQKRQKFFIQGVTNVSSPVLIGDTTINVDSTEGFLTETAEMQTLLVTQNEVIRYTGMTATSFTGCTRGYLSTQAQAYSTGQELKSMYRLQGQPIDLALKLMLSPNSDSAEIATPAFVEVEPSNFIANAIKFESYNIEETMGLVPGDKVTITGSLSNNGIFVIQSFGTLDTGSYVVVDGPIVIETASSGVAVFKSKYDVLPEGLGMKTDEVDVKEHEKIVSLFGSSFPSMDHYIKQEFEGRDFLHGLIYFPVALYPLIRKARASVAAIFPPFSSSDLVVLDEDVVLNTGRIQSEREVGKNFYDSVLYKFDDFPLEDKFKFGLLITAGDTRVSRLGNKPYIVEVGGIRDTLANRALLETIGTRILQRYKNAAELFPGVNVRYGACVKTEVGDKVLFGSKDLQLADITSGDRNFTPRLVEVMNKEMDLQTGEIKLDLMSTGANTKGRYASIAPQSYVGAASTATRLELKTSQWTTSQEFKQWTRYVGEKVLVHNSDFTFAEERTFIGIDPSNNNFMLLDVALSSTPADGWSVTAPKYSGPTTEKEKWKLLHCYLNPEIEVVSGVFATAFTVSLTDVTRFFVGSYVRLFKNDFSTSFVEVKVTSIAGTQINTTNMGGTPDNTYLVELIGFYQDEGFPYRLI